MNDTAAQPLQDWGGAARLDAFEALMWRLDDRPNLRAAVVSVEWLDVTPDWERLVAAHEHVVSTVPRLSERLVELPFGLGYPLWQPDPAFSLQRHLRRVRLDGTAGLRQVLDIAQRCAIEPFDETRPPWEAILVEGLSGGAAAYVLKLHHAMSDGMGIVQLLAGTHRRTREPSMQSVLRQRPAPRRRSSLQSLLAEELLRQARRLPVQLRAATRELRETLRRGASLDEELLIEALRYAASAQRILGPTAPPSPLLSKRSQVWRFETLELPLDGFKAAARHAGATLNDAFIAGLMGGFARYHRRYGPVPQALPITFPISLRRDTDAAGGNRFVAGQFAAPLSEPDPLRRMRQIGERVARIRQERALDLPMRLMPLINRLPTPLIAKAIGAKLAGQDLQISNVPGIRPKVFMAGAEVTRLFPFAPLPGCAGMISMVSHGEHCCIGLNLDSGAVTDPGALVQDLSASFDEILSVRPPASARRSTRAQ